MSKQPLSANVQAPPNFRAQSYHTSFYPQSQNVRVVKSEVNDAGLCASTISTKTVKDSFKLNSSDLFFKGEAVQLVRPLGAEPAKPSEQIINELLHRYDYNKNTTVRADL